MGFGLKVTGIKEVTEAFDQFGARGNANLLKAQMATAQKIRTDAVRSIQAHESSGVTYIKGAPVRVHTASSPGNPPNTDTGTLVSRIVVKRDKDGLRVGTALQYGKWLEEGTQEMAARPWLIPSMMRNEKFYLDALREGLRLAAKGLPLEFRR